MKRVINIITNFDWATFLPALILFIIGLVTIYGQSLNSSSSDITLFWKQLLAFGIGLVALIFFNTMHFQSWNTYGTIFYILAMILMGLVLFFGTNIRGTTGWFNIFGFGLQPVEIAKLALVIMLSVFYNKKNGKERDVKTIIGAGIITAIPAILTLLQPDFGSSAILIGIGIGFVALASLKKRDIIIMILLIAICMVVAWGVLLKDYQQERILTFVDPMRDPQGRGYNVRQSIIAIGSGKIIGRGVGLGTQSQLRFLPEPYTDFIFAAIAESLGFLGAGFVVLLFFLLFMRIINIMKNTQSAFGIYLCYGFGLMFFGHMIINIGMNIGVMPVTGLPLPFVSSGGSFLLVSMISLGIIMSVSAKARQISG